VTLTIDFLKNKITSVLFALFGILPVLNAQPYYFKHYLVENGLSNNSVSCSLQDKNGFLWFGTINGLNRFDGYSFKVFRHNPEDSTSIGSSFIRCLLEDQKGCLWIGTNKGIYLYHSHAEKFNLFSKARMGDVTDIKEDKEGRLWVISNFNLYCYDQQNGKVKPFVLDSLSGTASSIAIAADSTIWVSTSTGMIKKYDAHLDSFITYSILKNSEKQEVLRIEKIYPLKNGNLLVGTLTKGVKLFDVINKTFQDIVCLNPDKTGIYAREFMQLTEKEYWIGTETGIYIYNAINRTIIRLEKEYDNHYSISDNVIFTFCKDREGGLWVGTFFGGLNYYPKPFTTFQKYFPEYIKPSMSGNAIHEICKDQYDDLWVGTEDGGLNKMDLLNNTFTSFKPTGTKTSIAYHNIHGLLAVGDSLWIGTFMHGLDIMNIKTGKVIRHYNAGPGPHELKNDFIVTLFKTLSGDILVGTWKGLFRYNRQTDDFSSVPLFEAPIQVLWEDEEGTLWACTQGQGVIYYNPLTKQSGTLLYDTNNPNSLCDNHVNGILEDSRRNLWFATEGGLCKYQKDKKIFTRYTTKNGMPDNLVFRILEDGKNNLFISTSRGLACLNPTNGDIRTYTKSNGLLSDQFNYNSGFKDTDGRMFFGSVKGLISFKPDEFIKNTDIPPVYITGFQVNNNELAVNMKGSSLKESIIYTKNISLSYDQSTFSIDFAALSYTVPEMNEYSYKMEGVDKDWIFLKNNRKVYYTKLPPGNYTFKVKGSNSSGIWNNQEASLYILISPPYWQSIWAYLIYAAIVLGIAYVLINSYLNRLVEKNRRRFEMLEIEKEREIYHSKIEFFTNIAHEIRTPLTLIKMPLEKLMRKKNNNSEINDNLKTMEKNTNRLIDLTNQLLDFRKTEMDKFSLNFVKTDITELLEETFEIFRVAAEQKNIAFKLEVPGITLQAFVDPEALKKILSNLFSNAIKYAETKVQVKMQNFNSEDKLFKIVFRNDGYLIPYDLKEKIFQPFYRINETEKQSGTGIGLPLSRSLAELHKGVLDLLKSENGMNTFVLSLPIHQEIEFKLHTDESESLSGSEIIQDIADFDNSFKREILLVEDNKEILEFISNELTSDYLVRKALNGIEGLEIIKEGNIQLVISDIMMPVMDGLELCKRIKTNLEYSHIPIILLTAKNSLHAKIEGLEIGADAYIEKPFAFEHLNAQISNLLLNRDKIKEYFASSPLTHIKTIGYTKADKIFLEKLKLVIDENLTNFDIDVEQLSKIMNMSRPTFYRKIKALSNLTPNELIHIARLKKAAELLSEGNYKVYEVASMVGYSLQTNFARDFHKQFGMTPSEYTTSKQLEKNLVK
jgi:ligand-binding sensor domain-containing protein/signal transduction histidine kinase/DNA-binding response OmpR family regulator